MPKKSNLQDWVKSARNMMRLEMHAGAKWYLVESRGRAKLEVRDEGKYQSRVLNYLLPYKHDTLVRILFVDLSKGEEYCF